MNVCSEIGQKNQNQNVLYLPSKYEWYDDMIFLSVYLHRNIYIYIYSEEQGQDDVNEGVRGKE